MCKCVCVCVCVVCVYVCWEGYVIAILSGFDYYFFAPFCLCVIEFACVRIFRLALLCSNLVLSFSASFGLLWFHPQKTEHHLFPYLNPHHCRIISRTVRQVCAEFGVSKSDLQRRLVYNVCVAQLHSSCSSSPVVLFSLSHTST